MVYICEVTRIDDEFEIIFGSTEKHYINYINDPYAIKIRVGMIYIYYSYFSASKEIIKNKKLDPTDNHSYWFVKPKHIYESFDEAKKSIFEQLF